MVLLGVSRAIRRFEPAIISLGRRRKECTQNDVKTIIPLLNSIIASDLPSWIDNLRSLDLAHLPSLQLGGLRQLEDPLWHGGAGLQKNVGDAAKLVE